jgi:hypothetical protein
VGEHPSELFGVEFDPQRLQKTDAGKVGGGQAAALPGATVD